MSACNKINQKNKPETLQKVRRQYIALLFELKQQYKCLSKEVLFLALAIFDKFLARSPNLDSLQA